METLKPRVNLTSIIYHRTNFSNKIIQLLDLIYHWNQSKQSCLIIQNIDQFLTFTTNYLVASPHGHAILRAIERISFLNRSKFKNAAENQTIYPIENQHDHPIINGSLNFLGVESKFKQEFKSKFIPFPDNHYLCTDLMVISIYEPCLMCAMAMVHSRIKYFFYLFPHNTGALETNFQLQFIKPLNHHYRAYKIDLQTT